MECSDIASRSHLESCNAAVVVETSSSLSHLFACVLKRCIDNIYAEDLRAAIRNGNVFNFTSCL